MSSPRLAVIGAGAWGSNHVRVVASHPGCELVAVSDPDPAARERARALAPMAAAVSDPDRILSDPSIDAVVIATPAPTHAELCCAALVAGKHVLVEKPLALSMTSARDIATAAARSGRILMVGHLMLFHPAVVRLRDMLRTGALGRLHYVHSIRANLGRIRHDESVLWSFGPHELSMLDYLLDEQPVSLAAHGQCVSLPGIPDVVFLTLRYASGVMAYLHLSRIHPRKERRLKLVCADKLLEFDDVSREKLQVFAKAYDRPPNFTQFSEYLTLQQGELHVPQLVFEEPLVLQLCHFLDCMVAGARPRTDIDSGLRVAMQLDAAERSLASDGATVPLTKLP